jgi:hypothetical protein
VSAAEGAGEGEHLLTRQAAVTGTFRQDRAEQQLAGRSDASIGFLQELL